MGTGRGESLVPVLARHSFHWVIALDHRGLSTPEVYRELDRLRHGAPQSLQRLGDVEPLLEALASGDPRRLALLLGNDLQAAAVSLRPALRRTLRAGVDAGALAGIVSGSGPSCAFLCTDGDAAVRVAAELAGAGVCRTVRVATGPVPGARIVEDSRPVPPSPGPPNEPLAHA
jgi:4-diphosphocytidyl-2-C-methyl-D-erythritol kinase